MAAFPEVDFFKVKISEFSNDHKERLCNLVVWFLKLHHLMKTALMVYIEDVIKNKIDDPESFYTREHKGFIIFVYLLHNARSMQNDLLTTNHLNREDIEEALEWGRSK